MLKKFRKTLGSVFALGVLSSVSVWAEGEAAAVGGTANTASGMIGMIAPQLWWITGRPASR